MKEQKIHSQGTFRVHSQYPNSRIIFEKESLQPIRPYFCPICGRVVASGIKQDNALFEYGICLKCLIWWTDEEKISNESMSKRLQKFSISISKNTNYILNFQWNSDSKGKYITYIR